MIISYAKFFMKNYTVFSIACTCITALLITPTRAQWSQGSGTITTTNNVGIGTTTPTSKLDVRGGETTVDYLNVNPQNSSGEGGEISLKGSNGNPNWQIDVLNNVVRFHSGGYAAFNLATNGNLGIGTYPSSNRLEVNGVASVGYLSVSPQNNQGEGGEFALMGSAGNPSWYIDSFNNRLRFVSQVEAMSILSTGQVGIGTGSPGNFKLAVEGTIGAREIEVRPSSQTWADFVFDPTYRLPSLRFVEQFVKQHHHLPGIPSAEEVDQKGIGLGRLNALLLQKVEKLTLHVIRLQKQVNKLQ